MKEFDREIPLSLWKTPGVRRQAGDFFNKRFARAALFVLCVFAFTTAFRLAGQSNEAAAAEPGPTTAFAAGHLHLVERLELLGHSFICSGSASGHQWNGPRMGTPEGFGVFDCRADGTFDFSYQSHGWNA